MTTTWLGSIGLAVYYQLHQAELALPLIEWLHTLPEFRAALSHLVAVRWSMVIFTALTVPLIYILARGLFGSTIALLGAILIALDPHTISLSRIIGHDAPTAMFILLSLLFMMFTVANSQANSNEAQHGVQTFRFVRFGSNLKVWTPKSLLLSGIMAGFAFLSKAPALFLIPFIGLMLLSEPLLGILTRKPKQALDSASDEPELTDLFIMATVRLLVWLGVAYLTFVIIWPAAWQAPLAAPYSVIENAFLSATDSVEASQDGYWLVPNLGLFYYIVYGGFKLSPLVLVGCVMALWQVFTSEVNRVKLTESALPPALRPLQREGELASPPLGGTEGGRGSINVTALTSEVLGGAKPERHVLWLFLFALLFTLFMTLADKRSPRYILPIFPALSFVAAYGWYSVAERYLNMGQPHQQLALLTSLTLSAMLIVVPYMPYYYSYYNPLLGGSWTAPQLVKIGWGEGLDRVGRYLQRTQLHSRVGVAYASTVAPYFHGRIGSVTGSNLDALVLYRKQIQSGEPDPIFITYFQHMNRLFQVNLNGLNYAQVYAGPTLTMLSPDETYQPLAYRPLSNVGSIGESLLVDVVWPAEQTHSDPTVSLYPLEADPNQNDPVAGGSAPIETWSDQLLVSRHALLLPLTIERGQYQLYATQQPLGHQQPLGKIDLRHFQLPDSTLAQPTSRFVFNEQIAIIGYQFSPTEDYISVRLAWQALQTPLPDYTVFVQLLDMETNERVAGFDSQPVRGTSPTSGWLTNEVMLDEVLVAVPPDLPAGYYSIIVGLYQPETGQRLTLADGQDNWLLPWTFIWGDVE
ncbi:glycosyltransferase family 39 protein [Anaerolineales bacterium HSG25]|nr:glycosyltransferase family 39 protein [Anaerolineales bacterium HSG25]